MKLNLGELHDRRSKVYAVYFHVPEDYNYQMAIEELHQAYTSKNPAELEEAFYRVAYALRKSDSLDKAFQNIDALEYPEIKRLVQNIHDWYEEYDLKYSRTSIYLEDLILDTKHFILDFALKDYEAQQKIYCEILHNITGLTFQFDGIELVATQQSNAWNEDHPDKPKTTANKIMDVHIARKILEGRFDDTLYHMHLNSSDNLWHCDVLDEKRLQQIKRDQLIKDIHQASTYIAKITAKPCSILHLYPVENGENYRVLELLGAIQVKNYNPFNVEISDFNLPLLQKYAEENTSIDDLWLEIATRLSSEPRVPPTTYMTTIDRFWKYQFFMPTTKMVVPKDDTEEYCGFKKGFLLGKSF